MVGSIQPISIDSSTLLSYYNNRAGVGIPTAETTTGAGANQSTAGEPPWREEPDEAELDSMVIERMAGKPLFSGREAEEALESGDDEEKIFTAYTALEELWALADAAANGELEDYELGRATDALNQGVSDFLDYVDQMNLDSVSVIKGEELTSSRMDVGVRRPSYEYVGTEVVNGSVFDPIEGFDGSEEFTINVTRSGVTTPLTIDFSEIGPGSPSLDELTTYINQELEAAGFITRVERVKLGEPNEFGRVEGDSFGLKVNGVLTEDISFAAPDQEPAVFTAGVTGADGATQGQMIRWGDLSGTPTPQSSTFGAVDERDIEEIGEIEDVEIDTQFDAVATGPDGSVYAIARTNGELNGLNPRDDEDYALVKYDASGQLAWSRFLGEQGDLSNASISVSDNGQVAVAASSDGVNGTDSFVTVFESNGATAWTQRGDARGDDEALAVAFGDDGSVYVSGRTETSLDGQTALEGYDSYVQKFDGSGDLVWTQQFGSAGNDRATAITVADDGGIIVGASEGADASLVRLDPVTGAQTWSIDLGEANISDIAVDGSDIYLSGTTNADTFAGGQFSGLTDNPDAFAMKLDASGASPSVNWMQRYGGEGGQTGGGIDVVDNTVYMSGSGAGQFGATEGRGDEDAFLTAINATTGATLWTDSVSSQARTSSANDLVVVRNGDSDTLNALGLPSGQLASGLSEQLSDQIPVRPGDHFYLSVDGGPKEKVTIEEGETVRSLSFKVNSVLVLDGTADVVRGGDGQRLSIKANGDAQIDVLPGASGADALSALGLDAGLVRNSNIGQQSSASDAPDIVDLELAQTFSLTDQESAEEARDALDNALRQLRTAHRYAIDDPTLRSVEEGIDEPERQNQSSGPSAYQQQQLANLQAGLNRLTGGQSSGVVA